MGMVAAMLNRAEALIDRIEEGKRRLRCCWGIQGGTVWDRKVVQNSGSSSA